MSDQLSKATKRKPILLSLVGFAVLVAVGIVGFFMTEEQGHELSPVITERMVRYSFTLENHSNQALEQTEFKVFAPVSQTPFQKVERIEASLPYQLETGALGNQTLVFSIQKFPPFGQKSISISVWLKLADRPAFDSPLNPDSFLTPTVPDAAGYLVEAVSQMENASGPLQRLGSANRWVHESLQDVGYVAEDRGAEYALRELKGDCTEFAQALIAIARSEDVPALMVAGFPVQAGNSILQASDYHNWVMANADNQWRVADPHAGIFDNDTDRYIAFRLFQNQSGDALNSQRFFSYDPRVRVQMN